MRLFVAVRIRSSASTSPLFLVSMALNGVMFVSYTINTYALMHTKILCSIFMAAGSGYNINWQFAW